MAFMTGAGGRKSGLRAALLAGVLVLGGCMGDGVQYGLPDAQPQSPVTQSAAAPIKSGPAMGEVVGTGDMRVALLLPLSGEGNAARIAGELKNAALLAMSDAGLSALELVIKDTAGTTQGAASAAAQAVSEGASIVLGPLFSANVRAASLALNMAQIPMIAFSSDRSVAGPGVYLNSFLPQGVVDRTLGYAAAQGHRNVVAVLPNGPAGNLAEAQARQTLAQSGGQLTAVARYDYDNASVYAAVQAVSEAVGAADALFIPDGGSSPSAIVSAMGQAGIDLSEKKLLGTGQWTTANLADPALQGAWFADTDQSRFLRYKERYRERFGAEPSLTSALAYDTVTLAATVARTSGQGIVPRSTIENPLGFAGYTGVFRFGPDGASERGYALYEVRDGAAQVVDPAPTRFGGGS